MDKVLLTPVEAATVLGIGRSKMYQLLKSGDLDSVRIGSCRRIPLRAVHTFVAALAANAAAVQALEDPKEDDMRPNQDRRIEPPTARIAP